MYIRLHIEMFTVELVNLGWVHKFTQSMLCHTLDGSETAPRVDL